MKFRKGIYIVLVAALVAAAGVAAEDPGTAAQTPPKTDEVVADASGSSADASTAGQTSRMSERLIYAVDRTPENPFDTPRSVDVITLDDIRRSNHLTLADVLLEIPGFFIQQTNFSGGAPIIRGLMGKQVLVLVDGVKLNNATWRNASKEYLNIVDVNQVERIEIVRGVVSVLGTESLGGVINIITRKGPAGGESFGGSVGARYASAEHGATSPVQVYGSADRYRYFAGITYHSEGDLTGGSGVGTQPQSGYSERSAYGQYEYFLSGEKTVSLSYRTLAQSGVTRMQSIADGTNISFSDTPIRMQLGAMAYQDLTSRLWADTFRATVSWNRQDEGRVEVRTKTPASRLKLYDSDRMMAGSAEFSKFLAGQHIVYGVDVSHDTIGSTQANFNVADGSFAGYARGRYTNGATYQTGGIYVNDKFNLTRWATFTAGVRYGRFASAGSETTSLGTISIATNNSDLTETVDAVFHVTPTLNIIANHVRGYRAPNIDDISKYSERKDGIEVPNPNAGPEHVNSIEFGLKYDTTRIGGSAFYYKNKFKDLLIRTFGSFNGVAYFDLNKNGVRDPKEPAVLQTLNIGKSEIHGIELAGRWAPSNSLLIWANYNKTVGDDLTAKEPLQRIPPAFGASGIRWTSPSYRRPWAEIVYNYAAAQKRLAQADREDIRIGPNGTPGYGVLTIRGGLNVSRFRLLAGIENITNEKYKYHGSFPYRAGRQLVLGTEYHF